MKTLRHHRQFLGWFMICLMATWLPGPIALNAATITWDATSDNGTLEDGTGTWSTTLNNWTIDGGVTNQFFIGGDNVIFGGGTSGTAGSVLLGENITIGTLTFNSAFAGNYTIASTVAETLTINGGITANDSASITAATILGASQTWTTAAGKLLTISNAAGITGTGFALTVGGSGNTLISTGGINTGASGSLTKSGSGTLTISAASNYTGTTTLTSGILKASNTTALGTAAAPLQLNGGTLDLATDTSITAYNTTVGGAVTIASNKATAASAGITHTLGTLSIGANTLSITQGANATGATSAVTFGNVTQTGASVFDVASNVTLNLGALQTSAQNISKQGAGLLVLGAAANAARVAGNNILTAGTMRLGNASALGTTGVTLTLNGGTLDLATDASVNAYNTTVGGSTTISSNKATAASAGITHTLGTLSIGANTLSVTRGANATSGVGGLTFGATTLTGAAIFDAQANTLLTLGAVTNGTNLLTVQGAGNVTLSGIVGNGAGGITMNGTGTLTLSAANTYTGLTTISAGTVILGNATALGPVANASISMSGGTLNINNLNPTVSGLTGSGGTINSGVAGTPTFTVNRSTGNQSFAGVIANGTATSLAFTKGGTSTLTLSGANTYTGATTVTGGILQLQGGGTAALADTSAVILNSSTAAAGGIGGTFEYLGAAAGSSETVGALTLNNASSGAGTVKSTYGTSGNTQLTFTSATARSAGSTVNFVSSGGTNGTNNKIVITGQTANALMGTGSFFNGSDFAFYDTGAFVRGINYGVDAATSTTGTLGTNTAARLIATPGAAQNTAILNTLVINGSGVNLTFNAGQNLILNSGGLIKAGGGSASTISGGSFIGTPASEFIIRTDAADDSLILNMTVAGAALTKTGAGTLTLGAANQFTGNTRITEGALVVGVSNALKYATLDLNALDAGTVSFGSLTSVSLGSLNGSKSLALTTNNPAITIGYNSASTTYSGVVSTSGAITKVGNGVLTLSGATLGTGAVTGNVTVKAGTLILSGANTAYSGAFTVDGGILRALTSANALGASGTDVTLNTGATLQLFSDANTAFTNDVIIRGNATLNVDRPTTGTPTHSILTLAINNNTLLLSNGNDADLTVTGISTLNGQVSSINNANSNGTLIAILQGQVTGNGALNRLGTGGLVRLSNTATGASANNYSGGTNVMSGILQVSAGNIKLGTGAVYVSPSGTLRINSADPLFSDTANTIKMNIAVNSSVTSTTNISQGPTGAVSTTVGASYGNLQLETAFAIGTSANQIKSGPFGAALRLVTDFTGANTINMADIGSHSPGNAPWFLGAHGGDRTLNTTAALGADGNVYRLGANETAARILIIGGSNLLTGANSVVIGSPIANVISAYSGGTGTVRYDFAQNYSLGTTVNKGSTLSVTSTAAGVQNLIPSAGTLNIFGQVAFSGAYASTTTVQQTFTNTVNIMNTGFASAAGQNLGLVINNNAYTAANIAARLASGTNIYLSSGNFRYLGPTAAVTSTQALNQLTFEGGNLIEVSRGNATANNAVVTIANAIRSNAGTLTIVTTGGAFNAATGTDTKLTLTQINGVAPAVVNGMIAPWIIDHSTATTPSFVTSGVTGLGPVAYTAAADAATLQGLTTGTAIANVTTALTLTNSNTSVYALRVQDVAISGAFNITIGSGASASDGAGLILSASAARTHANNWIFGTAGNREAVIYNSTATFATTLSGTINANGLTKFGPGILTLTGDSRGTVAATPLLTGTITINQGSLIAANPNSLGVRAGVNTTAATTTPYVVDSPAIRLAGGILDLTGAAQATSNYLSNVTVLNDSQITSVNNITPRFGSLTFPVRSGGSTSPIILTVATGGTVFTGTTTLTGDAIFNLTAAGSGNFNVLEGQVTDAGRLEKWGAGTLVLTNGAGFAGSITQNNYTGSTVVNAGTLATTAGGASDTPFGTGSVTVQAGASLRLANPNNVTGTGTLVVNSDLTGLGAIAMGYNGALTSATTLVFNNGNTGGPFSGVIGIDVAGYNLGINQNTLAGGTSFLGSVGGANAAAGVAGSAAANFTGALTASSTFVAASSGYTTAPNAGGYYRLGGGGGVLNLNVANQLTGSNNVIFGAINNTNQGNSVAMVNGGGTVVLNQANDYSGITVLNQGQTVQVSNDAAFGTSTLIFNGGTLTGDAYQRTNGFTSRTVANNVLFAGDVTINSAFNGAPSDLTLSGTIGLSNSAVGGSMRTINVATATYAQGTGSIITLSGVISDGAGSSYNGLNKAGAGTLRLTNENTYTGITQITAGNLAITNSNQLGTNTLVNMNGGALSAWEADFTLNKTLNFVATSSIDVAEGRILTQDATSAWQGGGSLQKIGLGTLVLQGDNSMASLTIMSGVVNASANTQLGNTATPGAIIFNNASALYGTGGTPMLRFTNDIANFNRSVTSTTAGAISVDAGKTVIFTVAGTGTGALHKVGAGTVELGITNGSATNWNINAGILQNATSVVTGAPFGTASTAMTLNGGTLRIQATANTTLTQTGTLNINGGGNIALNPTGAVNAEITFGNIARTNQGTMVISPTANLGGTTNQRSRLLVTTNIFGVAKASAGFNGILAPVIVRLADGAANSDADFVGYDSTNGFITGVPTTAVTTLGALAPTAVGNITTAQTLTGTNSIYAFKTTKNVSGGTLQIVSNSFAGGNQTQLGGILINGAGTAAPVISSDLFFGLVNNSVSQLNGLNYGEGVVYTSTGFSSGTATLSGTVTANSFTKFGPGTLLFSGTNRITGSLAVQSGSVQFSGATSQPASHNLILNDAGTLDLNGGTVKVGALSGTAGIVTNTSATAGTVIFEGANNTTFTGTIQDGSSGTTRVIKGGSGTLTLAGSNGGTGNNPQSNVNTFTGGMVLRSGQITLWSPTALGSSGTFEFQGGTLALQLGGVGPGLASIIGGSATNGLNVIVNGTGTAVSTDNTGSLGASGFLDEYFQFNNLTVGNSTFTATPSTDSQNIRFAGITTGGNAAIFNVTTAASGAGRSVVELSGVVQNTGSVAFALNKTSTGTIRITGTANSYTGGTNIMGGAVQVTSTTNGGMALGTGAVVVNPGGALRIASVDSLDGVSGVEILSNAAALGALVLDGNFQPTGGTLTSGSMNSFLSGAVQIGIPTFTGSLDMSTIGDGSQFLGAYGASLGNGVQFLGSLTAGNGARYRLGANNAGGTLLTFAGADNVFSGANSVEIGAPISLFSFGGTAPTNSTGTVVIQNSNNYTGGTLINRGSTLVVETGGAIGGSTPLGTTGITEVRNGAILLYRGAQGSAYNANTGLNANAYELRIGGTIRLDNTAGLFSGAGGQGRWGDAVGITLNGGTFGFSGASNIDSYEKIGAVTLGLGSGVINLARSNSGTAILEVASISRGTQRGTLALTSTTAATVSAAGVMTAIGTLNGAAGYERLRVTTMSNTGGTVSTSGGAVTNSLAPVWMVDATNATFLSYQGATLGLQPLLSLATPGTGQVGYSTRMTAAGNFTSGLTGGTATVDINTGNQTLVDNPNIYALRTDRAITTGNASPITGNTTAGSNVIATTQTSGLVVGQSVTGTVIPAGAVITAINPGVSITISNQIAQTASAVAITPQFVGSSRVDLQACKLEYSIVSPK